MKHFKVIIMIAVSIFLLSPNFAYFQWAGQAGADIDWYEYGINIIMDRLKEEVDFDNWPCKDGPIRAGIILTKDHFSSFQEEENFHHISLMDDIDYILAVDYAYRWSVEGKGKVNIRSYGYANLSSGPKFFNQRICRVQ